MLGSEDMKGENAEKCLQQVFSYNKKRKYEYLLIIHTDGGGQYRSNNFQNMLSSAQIRPSHAKILIYPIPSKFGQPFWFFQYI